MRCLLFWVVAVVGVGCGSAGVAGSWGGVLWFQYAGEPDRSGAPLTLYVDDAGHVEGLCGDAACAGLLPCDSVALEYDAPMLAVDEADRLHLEGTGRATACGVVRAFDVSFVGERVE